MSLSAESPRTVVPAQLGFLAIYNPSLGTTDDTVGNQIVYYSSPNSPAQNKGNERKHEQLRQVGLAQGMVEFGRSFSNGKSVDTIETEKSRIILHELEPGWWILASINLTILPESVKPTTGKGKGTEQGDTIEYSSREVKPAILLLGDLLRAHSTFLLHHASSMSALFVRTRRPKFVSFLGRYWDTYIATWNVLMHGNPANALYSGIKIAACGELGVGVGEEERGSGEREVLEGFVGRIDGLVDIVVSKFGDVDETADSNSQQKEKASSKTTEPWLGSGNEPAAEEGIIFSGTGALSRKSLRDVSHWMEDLYRWGPYAYGVIDNPTSNRRTKKARHKTSAREQDMSPDVEPKPQDAPISGDEDTNKSTRHESIMHLAPLPIADRDETSGMSRSKKRRPSLYRGSSSFTSTDSESVKSNKFVQYLKFGYGTHWSLGGTSIRRSSHAEQLGGAPSEGAVDVTSHDEPAPTGLKEYNDKSKAKDDSTGHYIIGYIGNLESDEQALDSAHDTPKEPTEPGHENSRLLLRTLTLELEREVDARAEVDISIDLGNIDKETRINNPGSEHTGTSNTSFETQDRNKTKKLRVVVYANKPFIFVFLFELRTESLAFASLYRSLHHQVGPLLRPLLNSTRFRASKPDISAHESSTAPIYDLVWDPQLLTINSSIPNIPDPVRPEAQLLDSPPWSRIEALNTHMQIINTYIAGSMDRSEKERTCKTSRGWWVVWTRVPGVGTDTSTTTLSSGQIKVPTLIAEDNTEAQGSRGLSPGPNQSRGTSTFNTSMYSGPAHSYTDGTSHENEIFSKDKEIFLIRRASDHVTSRSSRLVSGSLVAGSESSWTTGPSKLAQGIGVDTKRYIDALLNLNR